ncbi:MAG: 4Fe-4S binding protein [Ferrovibrio sp.]
MRLDGKRVLVCNCEGTMPLDGKALAKACGASNGGETATQLCRAEIGVFQAALKAGEPLTVACTQESPLFDEQREELGSSTPVSYVNIRETAGWSSEAEAATPKIAALIAAAAVPVPVLPVVTMKSDGVALIYGRDEQAIAVARQLSSRLDVTIMLDRPKDVAPPPLMDLPVVQGHIAGARGHLGAFELVIDQYALPLPSSRRNLQFGAPRNGASSRCDIIIDLSGGTPLFPAHEKREGYFRPDPKDPAAVQQALFEASDLTGTFEKPIYVNYHADICAHSRSKKTGCTRCLDVCPTGAISPAGDHVAIDPFICGGCGNCGAVCPTGAAEYSLPPPATLTERLRALLLAYREAGGRQAVILLHDARHGAPLIDALARHGNGLPARVLPFAVNALGECNVAFFASAFAYGAADLRMLVPAKHGADTGGIGQQMALAESVLVGLGYEGGRVGLIETDDPDRLGASLAALPRREGPSGASYLPMGRNRDLSRLAFRHLYAVAPQPVDTVALAPGAPFGSLQIDVAGCTLCLACVSSCPTGALSDDPERPRLSFTEDACVQCGLCKATCPEKVIALEPRVNFTPDSARARVVKEEEPFHCIRCAKPFGTKSSIEKVIAKLDGKHWMYGQSEIADRMRMCADCRIIVQSESKIDPYAGAPRPDVRTTDDYIAERAAAELKAAGKKPS